MCECFDNVKNKVIKMYKDKIGKHEDFKAQWENYSFFFGKNPPKIPVTIPIYIKYRSFKKNGNPCRNLTKDSQGLTINFCPFCGEDQKRDNEIKKETGS